MKLLLILISLISLLQAQECTYNNVNMLAGTYSDSLIILGHYGKNTNKCDTSRTISSKFIESFSIYNQTNEVKIYMTSGEVFTLVNGAISFEQLVKIKINN
jgi:hypothetical protein